VSNCLALAFEPYESTYTPPAFRNTVLTPEEAEERLRTMTVLVVDDSSEGVVGTIALAVVHEGEGHVRGMAVLPRYQGRGLAERLLHDAEEELRARGCSRVTLDSTLPLRRAMRFYERCGYALTGVVKDFYGMPLHEYAKMLA